MKDKNIKAIARYSPTTYACKMQKLNNPIYTVCGVRFSAAFILLSTIISISACTGRNNEDERGAQYFLPSGEIVISRPVPEAGKVSSQKMLGFLPVLGSHSGVWLSISKENGSIELMDGSRVLNSSSLEGGKNIAPGSYQVLHKQTTPLWYAPDKYFTDRGLLIPPEGDKSRFRRGALGEYAIFINKETPIHSGPVWSDDVGGIRVSEADLSKIYNQLQVGSIIEVK